MPKFGLSRGSKPSIDLQPEVLELENTRSWRTIPQEDENDTSYNGGAPLESLASNQSSKYEKEVQLPIGKALKQYPWIGAYCLAMCIPIIGWGYDLVIVGSVPGVDSFIADYGETIDEVMDIPGNWLSLWMGLPPAGSALGAILGGWLQDRIGRKFTLLTGSIVSAIAISCIFFSHIPEPLSSKRMMLTAGLTVQGFSVGVIKAACLTWVSENTPTAIRGSAMALFPIFTLVGQLIGSIVLYIVNNIEGSNGYLGAFGSQWILCVGPFILSIVMPESPAHLLRVGQEARALKSATRLFAPKVSPYKALEEIRATIEEEKATTGSANYWQCFKGINLRRTMITVLANVIPTLFGLELLSSATVFLKSMGMESGPSLMIMIFGIVAGMLGNGIGFWLLSRTGRRNMTIPSLALAALLWGAMGVTGFWTNSTLTWVAAAIMIAVIVVCGLGCWPASYAIMGEASSLQLRSLTQGLGSVAGQGASIALAIVLPMLFSRDKAALGAKTGFVYCGLCIIGVLLSWMFIPEMKGRTAVEIDHMFELRLSARKFKHWRGESRVLQEVSPLTTSYDQGMN